MDWLIDHASHALFASLSGDHNPLHVDALHARRTQFGREVVHGVHLVFRSLASLEQPGVWGLTRIEAQFRGAVLVGEVVRADLTNYDDSAAKVDVCVGRDLRARIELTVERGRYEPTVQRTWPAEAAADTGDVSMLSAIHGVEPVGHDHALLAELFPQLAGRFSPSDATSLLALTRVIGMRCPGKWALFRQFSFRRKSEDTHESTGAIEYEIDRANERFSLLEMTLRSADNVMSAQVQVRAAPPEQPSLNLVSALVPREEHQTVRALVIGGSRGLGELAATIIVAAGGDVLLTYHSGTADANRVVRELSPHAASVQLDVQSPETWPRDELASFAPTHLLYFATPPIMRRPVGTWDPLLFDSFVRYYVTALSALLSTLEPAGLAGLFYPSSIFVDERPAGFAEYSAAKQMGEVLCDAWSRMHPQARTIVERLPPLLTDQTAGRPGQDVADNLSVLAPLISDLIKTR